MNGLSSWGTEDETAFSMKRSWVAVRLIVITDWNRNTCYIFLSFNSTDSGKSFPVNYYIDPHLQLLIPSTVWLFFHPSFAISIRPIIQSGCNPRSSSSREGSSHGIRMRYCCGRCNPSKPPVVVSTSGFIGNARRTSKVNCLIFNASDDDQIERDEKGHMATLFCKAGIEALSTRNISHYCISSELSSDTSPAHLSLNGCNEWDCSFIG